MYVKTISYKDYYGNERTEDFHFNLDDAELLEMEYSTLGGFDKYVEKISNTQDTPSLIKLFKDLILMSYGERSLDGRDFIKINPDTGRPLSEKFKQCAAYSVLFMELATNADAAAEFINNVVSPYALEAVKEAKEKGEISDVTLVK